MDVPVPITSIDTLPTELLEWLGEKKIKAGDGDLWVFFPTPYSTHRHRTRTDMCSSHIQCTGLQCKGL
jgi:hypothetical protein